MSKDPDLKDEADAKLRRRRKGGLRVPEDNVPRPTVAGPTPEDPRLAVSVAYAFSDDRKPDPEMSATLVDGAPPVLHGYPDDLESRITEPSAAQPDHAQPPLVEEFSTVDLPLEEEEEEEEQEQDEDVAVETPRPESVDIPFDDEDDESGSAPSEEAVAVKAAPHLSRLRTVALSDADLEELDDVDPAMQSARAGGRARLARSRTDPSTPMPAGDPDRTMPMPRLDRADLDLTVEADASVLIEASAPSTESPADAAGADVDDEEVEELVIRAAEQGAVEGAAEGRRRMATEPPPPPLKPAPAPVQSAPPVAAQGASKPRPPPAPTAARAAAVAAAADLREARKPRRRGKPWFEEIFDEDYLRTLPFLTPQATQLEANFVMEALASNPGSQILDLGCGYGRHAMELAARGYHVVGLDSSLPLLLRGADEAQRRGLSINFVHGDMREINFDSQFDGAYCLFSTFGYFDDETNKKTAQNIARALKPGARCVLEVLNRDYVVADLPSRVWWEGDGCVVLEEIDFNYFSSRLASNRSVVFDDGRQLEQEISIRLFSLHELGKLLHSAGFRVVEVSGSMLTRGRFFGAHSRDIVVVAERRTDALDGAR